MYVHGSPIQLPVSAAMSPEYYRGPLTPGYSTLEGAPIMYPYVAVPSFDPAAALADSFDALRISTGANDFASTPRPYGGWPEHGDWHRQQVTPPQPPPPPPPQRQAGPSGRSRGLPAQRGRGRGIAGAFGSRHHYQHDRGPGRLLNSSNRDTRQQQQAVKRTVYICDIDPQVTEAALAELFEECGSIMDCRVCGDPHTAMRFAFIEFEDDHSVPKAIKLSGRVVGSYPLRVRPSKTAIVPVNRTYLPRTEAERELCNRTVYAANIDKKVDAPHIRQFFESLCGEVSKLRLLGDSHHSTRIAFVEFHHADSARQALTCSGALLGSLPIRIAPSKTPVRGNPRT